MGSIALPIALFLSYLIIGGAVFLITLHLLRTYRKTRHDTAWSLLIGALLPVGVPFAVIVLLDTFGSIAGRERDWEGFPASSEQPSGPWKTTAASTSVIATRLFAGPNQYPPEEFAAYGILAFRSRASSEDRSRHITICEAYVASLPHSSELNLSASEQMVTIWPVDSDNAANRLNLMPRTDICSVAVNNYGLVDALQALKDAEATGAEGSGMGPFLLA